MQAIRNYVEPDAYLAACNRLSCNRAMSAIVEFVQKYKWYTPRGRSFFWLSILLVQVVDRLMSHAPLKTSTSTSTSTYA